MTSSKVKVCKGVDGVMTSVGTTTGGAQVDKDTVARASSETGMAATWTCRSKACAPEKDSPDESISISKGCKVEVNHKGGRQGGRGGQNRYAIGLSASKGNVEASMNAMLDATALMKATSPDKLAALTLRSVCRHTRSLCRKGRIEG
jgi:hypothetical protein